MTMSSCSFSGAPLLQFPTELRLDDDQSKRFEIHRNLLNVRSLIATTSMALDECNFIQTNHPIPRNSLIYYFEIQITEMKPVESILVGFAEDSRLIPHKSLGSHRSIVEQNSHHKVMYDSLGVVRSELPWLSMQVTQRLDIVAEKSDIIGAGIMIKTGTIFFTRNGEVLPYIDKPTESSVKLFPTVGFRSSASVEFNLGHKPFKYDIKSRYLREQELLRTTIQNTLPIMPPLKVVREYLCLAAFPRTLAALDSAIQQSRIPLDPGTAAAMERGARDADGVRKGEKKEREEEKNNDRSFSVLPMDVDPDSNVSSRDPEDGRGTDAIMGLDLDPEEEEAMFGGPLPVIDAADEAFESGTLPLLAAALPTIRLRRRLMDLILAGRMDAATSVVRSILSTACPSLAHLFAVSSPFLSNVSSPPLSDFPPPFPPPFPPLSQPPPRPLPSHTHYPNPLCKDRKVVTALTSICGQLACQKVIELVRRGDIGAAAALAKDTLSPLTELPPPLGPLSRVTGTLLSYLPPSAATATGSSAFALPSLRGLGWEGGEGEGEKGKEKEKEKEKEHKVKSEEKKKGAAKQSVMQIDTAMNQILELTHPRKADHSNGDLPSSSTPRLQNSSDSHSDHPNVNHQDPNHHHQDPNHHHQDPNPTPLNNGDGADRRRQNRLRPNPPSVRVAGVWMPDPESQLTVVKPLAAHVYLLSRRRRWVTADAVNRGLLSLILAVANQQEEEGRRGMEKRRGVEGEGEGGEEGRVTKRGEAKEDRKEAKEDKKETKERKEAKKRKEELSEGEMRGMTYCHLERIIQQLFRIRHARTRNPKRWEEWDLPNSFLSPFLHPLPSHVGPDHNPSTRILPSQASRGGGRERGREDHASGRTESEYTRGTEEGGYDHHHHHPHPHHHHHPSHEEDCNHFSGESDEEVEEEEEEDILYGKDENEEDDNDYYDDDNNNHDYYDDDDDDGDNNHDDCDDEDGNGFENFYDNANTIYGRANVLPRSDEGHLNRRGLYGRSDPMGGRGMPYGSRRLNHDGAGWSTGSGRTDRNRRNASKKGRKHKKTARNGGGGRTALGWQAFVIDDFLSEAGLAERYD